MGHNRTLLCRSVFVGGASMMLMLAGCAGQTATEKALDREAALHERAEQRVAERESRQSDVIETLPDWIVKKPSPDATGVYGAGIGTSESISLALQKANIDARRDMAQEIDQVLSAETTMAGDSDASFKSIVNTFIDSVDVAGAEDVDRVIQSGREGYRVYTLLKLPYPEFNRALSEFSRQDESAAQAMQSQYDQLMARVSDTPAFESEASEQNAPSDQQSRRRVTPIDGEMPDEALVRALQESR
ncbi:LPP20 family lipoprotein [Vreelandella massiliensis]|uniref:LPP20 family lipoprotein n=1 Tax=Vreelandella massiliensis TaxID=1816686 RepID=UPI00096A60D9|nr:LPP20 family lipoprotein [Halomonas massiliensis]